MRVLDELEWLSVRLAACLTHGGMDVVCSPNRRLVACFVRACVRRRRCQWDGELT